MFYHQLIYWKNINPYIQLIKSYNLYENLIRK